MMSAAAFSASHAHSVFPVPAPAAAARRQAAGFRSAHFGMNETQVRHAVLRDFPAEGAALRHAGHCAGPGRALALNVEALEPGPSAAAINYIFGAASHQLIEVNIVWTTADRPEPADRAQMAAAGLQLAAYFRKHAAAAGRGSAGAGCGSSALVLFAGGDPNNAAVEVRLVGVAIAGPNGKMVAPAGPTQLRLAYACPIGTPNAG